jgi:type II secretory pathway pseudopilin PulG
MKKSLVSPSFLKQKARQLKKEKSLSQSQALNEAAQHFGFSNYKNYLNVLEGNQKQSNPPIERNVSGEVRQILR